MDDRAQLTIRLPVYGSVAAGLRGFGVDAEAEQFMHFDPNELPAGVDPANLYIVRVDGNSMYEEGMARSIPDGAKLLVEAHALPSNGQIVVAYIPERELGVVKQYRQSGQDILLRSYCIGGPVFWASEYPEMRVEGVVRRVIYEP